MIDLVVFSIKGAPGVTRLSTALTVALHQRNAKLATLVEWDISGSSYIAEAESQMNSVPTIGDVFVERSLEGKVSHFQAIPTIYGPQSIGVGMAIMQEIGPLINTLHQGEQTFVVDTGRLNPDLLSALSIVTVKFVLVCDTSLTQLSLVAKSKNALLSILPEPPVLAVIGRRQFSHASIEKETGLKAVCIPDLIPESVLSLDAPKSLPIFTQLGVILSLLDSVKNLRATRELFSQVDHIDIPNEVIE